MPDNHPPQIEMPTAKIGLSGSLKVALIMVIVFAVLTIMVNLPIFSFVAAFDRDVIKQFTKNEYLIQDFKEKSKVALQEGLQEAVDKIKVEKKLTPEQLVAIKEDVSPEQFEKIKNFKKEITPKEREQIKAEIKRKIDAFEEVATPLLSAVGEKIIDYLDDLFSPYFLLSLLAILGASLSILGAILMLTQKTGALFVAGIGLLISCGATAYGLISAKEMDAKIEGGIAVTFCEEFAKIIDNKIAATENEEKKEQLQAVKKSLNETIAKLNNDEDASGKDKKLDFAKRNIFFIIEIFFAFLKAPFFILCFVSCLLYFLRPREVHP